MYAGVVYDVKPRLWGLRGLVLLVKRLTRAPKDMKRLGGIFVRGNNGESALVSFDAIKNFPSVFAKEPGRKNDLRLQM